MVRHCPCDERVQLDRSQINWFAENRQRTRLRKWIVLKDVQKLRMQGPRQVRSIDAPRQYVEAGGIVAGEIVVDPVIPNEIIGAHPGKHASKAACRKNSLARRA